jgi:queuine/archaeosine tRNA-ribosyltransferase
MDLGLRAFLGVPDEVDIYLDNGAFYFLRRSGEVPFHEYEEFVRRAGPDWYPIPRDFIPSPAMSLDEQQRCLRRTMHVNRAYRHDGYVPVIHAGALLDEYITAVQAYDEIRSKPAIWLGGLVPQLLRSPRARPYAEIIDGLRRVRQVFADKHLHLFGIGGTATLHLAALIGVDSADSSGWRNRAARGIVQLPGRGDRMVADLGSWRGRVPNSEEWELLATCGCPACQSVGLSGLKANRLDGFCNRATHNLWTLLDEARQVARRLADGSYAVWYPTHVSNSIYRPLIDLAVRQPTSTSVQR